MNDEMTDEALRSIAFGTAYLRDELAALAIADALHAAEIPPVDLILERVWAMRRAAESAWKFPNPDTSAAKEAVARPKDAEGTAEPHPPP